MAPWLVLEWWLLWVKSERESLRVLGLAVALGLLSLLAMRD